jgi:putative transcriptional regulator
MRLKDLQNLDIEAEALAIEADAGESLPDIRTALAEIKSGHVGRVTTSTQILVRQARAKSGLTQAAFAERIQTPIGTLRDWEQGRFVPPGGVLCLLRLIVRHPELSRELSAA